MVKKSNFLKTLLTTASVLAVTASAGSAMAEQKQNIANQNATIANGVGSANVATPAAPGGAINFTNGDDFKFVSANTLATGGVVTVGTIDLNNQAAGPFTVVHNVDLNSVIDSVGTKKLAVIVNNGQVLKLTGANVSALGNLTLGSGAGNLGTLDITANGTTITGTIENNAAANGGVININATDTVFEGSLGAANALGKLDIKAGKNATLAKTGTNKIDDVLIGDGSTLNIGAGVNITSTKIDGAADKKGKLVFAGASTVAATTIGNTGANTLEAVEINNGLVEFSTTTDFKAVKTTLKHANSAIKFTLATDSETDFETATNGEGKLIFADDHVLKGNIGADGAAIGTVEVVDGKNLLIEKDKGKLYATNVTSTGVGTSGLGLQGTDYEIHTNIGTSANKFLGVSLRNAGALATTFKLMDNKNIHATDVDLTNNQAVDNILELHEGSSIIGNIATTNVANGTISVKGNTTIDGTIGAGNAINQIKFDEAKTLTVTKNTINANAGVNFDKDGTLELTETAALDVTQAVIVAKNDANGLGAITVNKATAGQIVKFAQIGDVAADNTSLRLLEVTGGANLELSGTVSIKKLDLGSSNAEIKLTKVNGDYLISELAHEEGNGSLVLGENITLKEGTNLGSALEFINITDKTLTVEDGVNLTATKGIRSSGVGNGNLLFTGSSTVSGVVGSNNTLNNVTVNSVNKNAKVDFLNKFNIAGNLVIAKGDIVTLRGEVVAANIQGNVADEGTVKFFNEAELSAGTAVTAQIGAVRLETVVLGGKNITFDHANFDTKTLAFEGTGELTATFTKLAADELQNTTITTDSTTRGHHITLSDKNQTFKAAIGTADNQFGNFHMLTAQDITVEHADFYAGITTEVNQKGTATFNAAQNANVAQLGDATNELLTVNFNGSITAHGGVYSKDIIVAAAKTATFKDIVKSSNGMVIGAGTNIVFDGANAKSEAAIDGAVAGNGVVEFNNTTTITTAIGAKQAVSAINFTGTEAAHVANVGANLAANNITIGGQTFKPTADIKLTGTTAINGSTLELGSANVTLENAAVSVMTGDVTVNTMFEDGAIGHLTVDGAASVLNVTANTLTINITDNDDLPVTSKTFKLFDTANNGTVTNTTIATVASSNNFIKWTQNGADLTRSNNAVEAITAALGNANKELLADGVKYGNANNTGDAKAFTNDLSKMTGADGKIDAAKVKEALQRVTENTAIQAPKMVAAIVNSANNTINNRMGALSNHPQPGKQLANSRVSGVSAGEGDHTMYGAWVSPFYNTTTQKELKGTAGFKSDSYGATIGFDTQANADLTVGVAGTYARTEMKHKNFKSGDKTKADTFLFNIYAIQQLTNEWFLQGSTSFSSSRIKNTEKRNTSTVSETAKGNFDTTSFTAEMLAGYNHNMMDNAIVTPLMGASFTRINDGGYKETGTTNQNLNITRKATNKFEAILGLRAEMTTSMEGIDVTPEIHAFVRHDLIGQDAKVTAKHAGLVNQLSPKSAKAQKTTFNVGFGVNAVSGMYEYGAGYDLNVAEKSLGHQGTLKVRLNF